MQGGEDQDVQKHVSVGRVEGTGRNPFTSRLGLGKVQVNLSLPCTGVVRVVEKSGGDKGNCGSFSLVLTLLPQRKGVCWPSALSRL